MQYLYFVKYSKYDSWLVYEQKTKVTISTMINMYFWWRHNQYQPLVLQTEM